MSQMTIRDKILQWEALRDRQAVLDQKIAAFLIKIQQECLHPVESLVEGSYAEGVVAQPPFRVCGLCGFAEEGWGVGYKKLAPSNHDIPTLPRGQALMLVRGPLVRQNGDG